MRKLLLFCTLLISISISVTAQSFGVCAGISKTDIRSQFLTDPSGTLGLNLGFINFIPVVNEFYIYQDFTVNTLGMNAALFEFDEDFFSNPVVIAHPDEKLTWFSAQYSLGPTFAYDEGKFYGGAGLSGSLVVPTGGAFNSGSVANGYYVTSELYEYSVNDLSSGMFGFFGSAYVVAGGGTESLKLHLKYNLMFTNLANSEYTESDNKMYADVVTISLAYLFY